MLRHCRPLAGVAVVLAAALVTPALAAAPASADTIRQQQRWVISVLHLSAAWRISRGRGVIVAVIDSGVDPTISDLTGQVITGPDLTGVNTPMSNPNWGNHGTFMAALIAGHGHGPGVQEGVIGVAPQARILSIRTVTDPSDPGNRDYQRTFPGKGQQEIAAAIRYAVSHGAKVISMSIGGQESSLVERSALQDALAHNVVVVASSGNMGDARIERGHGNAPYIFPADYPGVISVAAVGQSGRPAGFSSANLSVEVAAPGVNVPDVTRANNYYLISGTSPACALTAGVAALIESRYPRLTVSQVRRAIVESASNRPAAGYDDEVGFGVVNAYAALRLAGELSKQSRPEGSAAAAGLAVAKAAGNGFFGGGKAALPPVPLPPQSRLALLLYCALAAICLLVLTGLIRQAAVARGRRRPADAEPRPDDGIDPDITPDWPAGPWL